MLPCRKLSWIALPRRTIKGNVVDHVARRHSGRHREMKCPQRRYEAVLRSMANQCGTTDAHSSSHLSMRGSIRTARGSQAYTRGLYPCGVKDIVVRTRDRVGDLVFEKAMASYRNRIEPTTFWAVHAVNRFSVRGRWLWVSIHGSCVVSTERRNNNELLMMLCGECCSC